MANNKDVPQVWRSYGTGTGGYRRLEHMNERELADRDARQKAYDAMLVRQEAYEARVRVEPQPALPPFVGCVFAKSCNLPHAHINHNNPCGYIPTELLADYGAFALLGGRKRDDAGLLQLRQLGGTKPPAGMGTLALGSSAVATGAVTATAAGVGTVAAGLLVGMVALLWPSRLGDSALYSDDQLRSLARARTRVRLQVEQQIDGSLKGYAFYTGKHHEWEMVDVVSVIHRDMRYVADLGDGVELIWTPAVDPADTLGIPSLENAPQVPNIWVYPPTEAADNIIVNPVYPPEYKDFILVFPADSGVRPLYVVVSTPRKGMTPLGHGYHPAPKAYEITGFPGLTATAKRTPVKGGGGLRHRWIDAKKRTIYEWDSMHGELEAYRARDGSHLGAFDPFTGEQIGSAKDERSISKYL